jgi:hypothetical protein
MAIRIKLPNGQYGNFPDDMPHDQIEAVLQKQFPVQPQQPEQSFLNKLPRNIGAGALQGLTGLANIPYNIAQMLPSGSRKDPYETALGESLRATNAERIPHIQQHDYAKMLGIKGQPTASDEAIQLATELALPIGGAGKLAVKGAKALAEHLPAVTSKGLAKEISSGRDVAKEKYRGLYNALFQEAEKKGLTKIEKPRIKSDLIEKNSMPKYHTALKEFLGKPTIENAHKAQSDLGKLERAMEKSDAINPLTSSQQRTYRAVQDAKNKIKESMFKDHPELSKKYSEITGGYRSDVIPYTSNKSLNQFTKGELGHQKLIQRLKNNDAFMLALGKQYPGLKINDLLKSKKSKYILSTILGAAGIKGVESLIH